MYSVLIFDLGWTISEVDNMDICYYFEVLAYRNKNLSSQSNDKKEEDIYIDQCYI